MGKILIYQAGIFFLLLMARPAQSMAGSIGTEAVTDTVPDTRKPPQKKEKGKETAKKKPDIIKEVPKTRRQMKPIPVPAPIPVKPIKVIKPKVIKKVTGIIR